MIPVLTLDGPSGVGKGTVASIIAQKLDWHLLDSGAIYRAFAIVARDNDIKPNNIDEIMSMSDIDGVLVGGASLDPNSFARIANYQ